MLSLLNEPQVEELEEFEFDEFVQFNFESVIETDESDWMFVE